MESKRIEKVKHHFDLVVIVRGGGGEVGLSCYNNFSLCKAIAEFPLPVLTGIGHSTNLTVAEMIAFRNAITPTELGEFLLQAFHEVSVPVLNASEAIRKTAINLMEQSKTSFNHETKNFKNNVKHTLSFHSNQLIQWSRKLNSKTDLSVDRNRERIQFIQKELRQSSKRFLTDKKTFFDDSTHFLSQNSINLLENKLNTLEQSERAIELLHPKNVLKRGYSIARFKGSTISSKNPISASDEIEVETFENKIVAVVERVKK